MQMIQKAQERGAKYFLVSNPWHLPLLKDIDKKCICLDFRFNITNSYSLAYWQSRGFSEIILSPELTVPQCRDLMPHARIVAYGRIPLMILEKCVGKELGSCDSCSKGDLFLQDRTGVSFPVLREWKHRSLVCNSRVTWVADQIKKLKAINLGAYHFIFTTESSARVDEIIDSYKNQKSPDTDFRRIGI